MIPGYPTLFHATRLDFLPNILKRGLLASYCGKIHGEMGIRPPEKGVYLSKFPESNNLNSNLFAGSSRIVVLEIKTDGIDPDKIYPDDALFCGFGNEDIFENEDEISEATGWSLECSREFLEDLCATTDTELAEKMRFLWQWYLEEHGEISVAHDIPSESIICVRDYETGRIMYPRNDHTIDRSLAL